MTNTPITHTSVRDLAGQISAETGHSSLLSGAELHMNKSLDYHAQGDHKSALASFMVATNHIKAHIDQATTRQGYKNGAMDKAIIDAATSAYRNNYELEKPGTPNFEDMSTQIKNIGGGTFDWYTGKSMEGTGFMVAKGGRWLERTTTNPDAKFLEKYHTDNDYTAGLTERPNVGGWRENEDHPITIDISTKYDTGSEAREAAAREGQKAIFALGGTEIRPGVTPEDLGNNWGADIYVNVPHPKGEDVDPAWNKPESDDHFSNWEVETPKWKDTVIGQKDGKDWTLKDHIKHINNLHAKDLRKKSRPRRKPKK